MSAVLESMVCPACTRRTYHPRDVEYGWCGNCHSFTRGSLIIGSEPVQRWCAGMCGHPVPADGPHGVCQRCLTRPFLALANRPFNFNGPPQPLAGVRRRTSPRRAAVGCALLLCCWLGLLALVWLVISAIGKAVG